MHCNFIFTFSPRLSKYCLHCGAGQGNPTQWLEQGCSSQTDHCPFVHDYSKVTLMQFLIHRIHANMADHSVGARDELHESEAREASVFCFDNASPEKSCFADGLVCFISPCLRVFEFLNATRRDWNLPQKRESFFSVSPFASEEKTDEVKEFTITERTVKVCLLHFRLEYLRKCVTDRIYFQVGVIWLNAFTGFNDGGSWSSFAWWFHRNICFVRFSLSKVQAEVNNFFFRDRGYLSRVPFLYLGEGPGHAIMLEHPDIT